MKKTVRLLLAMLLALSLVSLAYAQEGIEVGDSIEDEAEGEPIQYEIELEEGDVIIINLTSDDFDTLVRVLDEDEDEIDNDDDGGEGFNSQLEFEAEDDASYLIVVDAFDGEPEGDFELSVEAADEDDDDDSGSSEGATYEGDEGDVITILVSGVDEESIYVTLFNEDGDEVASTSGYESATLPRVELPDDGEYTVFVGDFDDDPFDDADIEIFEEEALNLSEGPQTSAELSEDRDVDVMFFEAEEDILYFIQIELDGDLETSVNVEICEGDLEDCFFNEIRVSVAGTELAGFVYEASDDEIVWVILDYFVFGNDEVEVTITVEEFDE